MTRRRNLIDMPTEIVVYHIMPRLAVKDLIQVSRVCKTLARHARVCLTASSTHPFIEALDLPPFIYILSYDSWHQNLLHSSEKSQKWFRKLIRTLQRGSEPAHINPDLPWILSSIIRTKLLQKREDPDKVTPVIYCGFFCIIFSCFDREPEALTWMQRTVCHEELYVDENMRSVVRPLFLILAKTYGVRLSIHNVAGATLMSIPDTFQGSLVFAMGMEGDENPASRFLENHLKNFLKCVSEEASTINMAKTGNPDDRTYRPVFEFNPTKILGTLSAHVVAMYPLYFSPDDIAAVIDNAVDLEAVSVGQAKIRYMLTFLVMRLIFAVTEAGPDKSRMFINNLPEYDFPEYDSLTSDDFNTAHDAMNPVGIATMINDHCYTYNLKKLAQLLDGRIKTSREAMIYRDLRDLLLVHIETFPSSEFFSYARN